MSGTYGIENLRALVQVGAKLGNVAGKVFEDGKLAATDLACVVDVAAIFPLLVGIKFGQLMPEIKDIQPEEGESLIASFKEAFDLPQDSLETKIEDVLDICVSLEQTVMKLLKVLKKTAPAVSGSSNTAPAVPSTPAS